MKRLATVCCFAIVTPAVLAGQVGHAPESSPYKDLRAKHVLSLSAGYLGGSAGAAGVGPTDGPLFGARLDLLLGGPAEVFFGLDVADLSRLVLDPTKGAASRVKGTFNQSVIIGEAGLAMRLTGQKTWNGLVPYFGLGLGVAFGSGVAQDSSTFEFGTKFHVDPRLGIRWFPTDRINFRFEFRDVVWRLRYPALFFDPPVEAPEEPSLLDPVTMDDTEWTHHPTLVISLGYAIRL